MEDDNERKGVRFPTEIKTRYLIDGEDTWKECTVVDMSREVMDIVFRANEEIPLGTIIHLKAQRPQETEVLNIKGTLKWIRQSVDVYVGGIEWCLIDREDKAEGNTPSKLH